MKLALCVIGMLIPILMPMQILAGSESNWQLEKDASGIKVYTRSTPASDFKEFKAMTKVKAEMSFVFATIIDPTRLTHWMADTLHAEVLNQTQGEQSAYIIQRVPFPLTNRDGVFDYSVDKSRPDAITIHIRSGAPAIKVNKDYIRIRNAKGYWLIERQTSEAGETETLVTYQMLLDPGGTVPSWLANSQVVNVPFNTLKNLHKEVAWRRANQQD